MGSIINCFFTQLAKAQLRSGLRGFKGMEPEIALNRWLTCGCIVSATRKITARRRWRRPRCRSPLMAGFPVILALPFVRSRPVTRCPLAQSIPASRDRGRRCALWRRWPPAPSVRPFVHPTLHLPTRLKP